MQKYYPPDFDPSKIPRLRLPKNRQYTVRIMAPCNMRCNTCGDYIARGKKFNARKETVENEEYLGLKVFRFYFKCPRCMQEITFKTDPKSYDYVVEHGATPNFKALKLAEQQAIEEKREKEEEEMLNPMKLLENRTKASRREMENLEALEDLKEMNQREVVIDYEDLLKKKKEEFEAELRRQEEMDEKFVQSIFGHNTDSPTNDDDSGEEIVEEFELSHFSQSDSKPAEQNSCTELLAANNETANKKANKRKLIGDLVIVKKKKQETAVAAADTKSTNALSSLCGYSDSESDS